jgi:hypothetical protein
LANSLWAASNQGRWRRFRSALADPAREQEQILRRYLRRNAKSVFGREHRLEPGLTVAEFQRRVPIRGYDEYRPWIERVARGESAILTSAKVRRLVPSSGSTAARKLIPYTHTLLREFNRGIGPWVVDLYREIPDLRSGSAYWSISPPPLAQRDDAASKVPVGFEADSAYLGGVLRWLVDRTLAVPSRVSKIADHDRFVNATLVHLLRARDLRLISVWHPSFLTLLLDALENRWRPLVEEAGRQDLPSGKPARWRSIWPHLRLISCWGDANAAGALEDLRHRLAGIRVQPKGLIATEAFVSLPLAGARPVAIRSHFFEFLDGAGYPHLIGDLEFGAEYSVVVTTGGGLYRYRLHDRVRVDGFVESTPSLRFVGKEDHVSDLRGEKLTEGHVGRILREVSEALGLRVAFAMLAPDQHADSLGYTLYLQSDPAPPPGFAEHVERALGANPHYSYCVILGQLAPLRVFVIRGPAHLVYLDRCAQVGRRLGDIKPSTLSRERGWSEWFDGHYLEA